MQTVLLTGGTGFIGRAIAQQFFASGWRVRLLVRDVGRVPSCLLGGPELDVRVGDLREPATIKAAVPGVHAICHAAADYRLFVRDPEVMHAVNVVGTMELMEAALAEGVARIVHVSSVATIKPRADGPADETCLLAEADAIGPYKLSKLQAEAAVLDLVRSKALPAVVVNPSTPIGPGDSRPTPTGRLIVAAARGRIPAFVDTGLNLVHVEDVAWGCVQALEKGRIGERYILGGDDVHLRDLLAEVAALVGRRAPRIRLPRPLAMPIAWASECIAALRGTEPLATIDGVRMARHHMFFSSAKAKRELDYAPRDHRLALQDAVAFFRSVGMIDKA